MRTRVEPTCAWVRDRIEEFVEGELGDAERTAVAGHASACPECEREIALSRSIRAELPALPVFALPPAVVERAEARIARGRFRSARWAAVVATTAAAAAAAWLAWPGPARPPRAPDGTAADPAAVEAALRDLKLAFAYVDRYVVRALEESGLVATRSRQDRS